MCQILIRIRISKSHPWSLLLISALTVFKPFQTGSNILLGCLLSSFSLQFYLFFNFISNLPLMQVHLNEVSVSSCLRGFLNVLRPNVCYYELTIFLGIIEEFTQLLTTSVSLSLHDSLNMSQSQFLPAQFGNTSPVVDLLGDDFKSPEGRAIGWQEVHAMMISPTQGRKGEGPLQ